MFTSPGVLIVTFRTRPSQGLPVKRLPCAPTLPPQVLSKRSRRAICKLHASPFCRLSSWLRIPLAHMLKKQHWSYLHPDEHPPNIAMTVRHLSISLLLIRSRRDRILWDFIESTQHAPHYFSSTTQILSVLRIRKRWKGIFNLARLRQTVRAH
jgi:hypothetical protein